MSVDRLTAEDQVVLWPDPTWPWDIGAVAVLDGVIGPRYRKDLCLDAAAIENTLGVLTPVDPCYPFRRWSP